MLITRSSELIASLTPDAVVKLCAGNRVLAVLSYTEAIAEIIRAEYAGAPLEGIGPRSGRIRYLRRTVAPAMQPAKPASQRVAQRRSQRVPVLPSWTMVCAAHA